MAQKKKIPQPVNEGLSFLIENVMEKSEVVLAVKNIRDKLTNIAEDIAGFQAKDVMPLLDSMTEAFGPQVADAFSNVTNEQFQQALNAVQAAKSAIDKEILRLEKGVEGGDMSDFGMDTEEEPEAPPPGGEAPAPAAQAPAQAGGLPEVPATDFDGNAEDDALSGGFAGRPAKESRKPRGKVIKEFFDDGMGDRPRAPQPALDLHPHKSEHFHANLANIGAFHGKAGELARNIENMIDSERLSGEERSALANVLSEFSAVAHQPHPWTNPEMKLEASLRGAGLWDHDHSPAVAKIVHSLSKLAHLLSFKHDGVLESNIKALKSSADPDATILRTFRLKLAESRDAQLAAIGTARSYAIDVEDVVSIVKEAARLSCRCKTGKAGSKKPVKVRETNKKATKKPVGEEHIGFKKLSNKLAHQKGIDNPDAVAAAIGQKKYGKAGMAKKAAAGRKHVREEETQPSLFPIGGSNDVGNNLATGAVTSQPAQPAASGSTANMATRKPMTPADRHAMAQTQTSNNVGVQAPQSNAMFKRDQGPMVPSNQVGQSNQPTNPAAPSTQPKRMGVQQVRNAAQ